MKYGDINKLDENDGLRRQLLVNDDDNGDGVDLLDLGLGGDDDEDSGDNERMIGTNRYLLNDAEILQNDDGKEMEIDDDGKEMEEDCPEQISCAGIKERDESHSNLSIRSDVGKDSDAEVDDGDVSDF